MYTTNLNGGRAGFLATLMRGGMPAVMTGVSMIALACVAGCGSAVESPGQPSPGSTAPTARSDAGSGTVSISGFTRSRDGVPVAGVQVCSQAWLLAAANGCTTSASDGAFTIAVPANVGVGLIFQKDGFLSALRAVDTQASDITLPEEETLIGAATPQPVFGAAADPNKGHIAFFVNAPGTHSAPDVSVTLDGSPQQTPIYVDAIGAPIEGATAGSRGGFINVPPGWHVLRFGGGAVTCTASGLYGAPMTASQDPSSLPGQASVLVPVMAGTVTAPVSVTCVP
jgi:hypothetical protein